MASPAAARRSLTTLLRYLLLAVGGWGLSLLVLQALLAQRLERAQISQMGPEVAFNLRLGELALERLPPAAVAKISGLRLQVGPPPPMGGDRRLQVQASRLQLELCRRLSHCPVVRPAASTPRGVWVELLSPLEPVWLFAPLRPPQGWPPDPLLSSLALLFGGTAATLLFLWLEVQRPLQQLESALARVGLERNPAGLAERGTGAVRRLTGRFNAMLQRLERNEQERSTMLAGIAHDLKSPLTRLRLRLSLAGPEAAGEAPAVAADRQRSEADLDALERITAQFLLFAGGGESEAALAVPLEQLLAESSAAIDPALLVLDLEPVERLVQPTALARAVGNLIDNALSYGRPPLTLRLRPEPNEGFAIEVWDHGEGIAEAQWAEALLPFQRLDAARGGAGHCGLGLAIAERVAAAHGGGLYCRRQLGGNGPGFAVGLRGRSVGSGHI
ncbi:MAG: ATP-binding protein [Prochlorococcaceae cyanobacterium]